MIKLMIMFFIILFSLLFFSVQGNIRPGDYYSEKMTLRENEPTTLMKTHIKTEPNGNFVQNIVIKDGSMGSYGAFNLKFRTLFCFFNRCYFWLKVGKSVIKPELKQHISGSEYLSLLSYYYESNIFDFELGYVEILFLDSKRTYLKVQYHEKTKYFLYSIR